MYIYVKDLSRYQSIHSIKLDLMKKYGIKNIDSFYLKSGTHILDEKKTLYDYKVKNNERIEIVNKKEGGKNMAYGLKVFLFVLVFLAYFITLLLGVLPFFSFLISNILIKALKVGANFCLRLVDRNNWFYNFIQFTIHYIIPFIGFILEYAGMAVFIFFLTFFCTYKLYYFKFTKNERDESLSNQCKAFKNTKIVAGITTLIVIGFYFIANIPIMIGNIAGTFLPAPFKGSVKNAMDKLAKARSNLFGLFGPVGMILRFFIIGMGYLFKGFNYILGFDADLLYNWTQIYQMTKVPPLMEYVNEAKIEEILEYVNFAELAEQGKRDPDLPVLSMNQAATAYSIRSVYDNTLYVILAFIKLLDICNQSNAVVNDLMDQKDKILKMKSTVEKSLRNNSGTINKNKLIKSIAFFNKQIKSLSELIEAKQNSKLLDVDCLMNILTNGALFSVLIVIIFLIIFIVFFFVSL